MFFFFLNSHLRMCSLASVRQEGRGSGSERSIDQTPQTQTGDQTRSRLPVTGRSSSPPSHSSQGRVSTLVPFSSQGHIFYCCPFPCKDLTFSKRRM